ncbi:MAG: magnesium transporter [Acidobacteriota bacterium]
MEAVEVRRNQVLTDTLRRFVRRGARSSISKLLAKVRPEDLGMLLRGLTPSEGLSVFRIAVADYPDSVGSVLTELESSLRTDLVSRMDPSEVAGVLDLIAVDDAVFVVESLPSEVQERVLEIVDLEGVTEVQSQLTFEDDSAGRIMTREFFSLPESNLVREAIATIQDQGEEIEMIFYLYIVDEKGELIGVTSLRQLLLSAPGKSLRDIAQRDLIKVTTSTDQEEVAHLAARYDLLAIPVTDDRNRLVGIVTVDDIVDIVKEEATEDFLKMVGTNEGELLYQERALRVARIRLPWLLINLGGLLLTGLLLAFFQVRFSEALFLLTFVPLIMGMGGNVGTQTSTITVRGLATGGIPEGPGRIRKFLWSQIRVGAVIGLVTGLLVAGAASLIQGGNPYFALVVSASLFMAILLASLSGAMIPLLFERIGIDPAVAAGPLVTTSNDITGILIYFGFAGLLIEFLIR